ncbi:aminotransferase class I/II-fold pyridoxal phosphate-dependent enzyme, partial [Candidatus Woesearchaeota archaeon]|nr:aminotransferase class I/II-fold pyridoxal phosphate-dependent enzyme [Candidatus Woesearchaeota archaeon]
MEVSAAERIKNLSAYAFAAIEEQVQSLKKQGVNIIDFGVGDPKEPTPGLIRNYTKRAIDKRKDAGYPSYDGSEEFRETVAKWAKERFNVSLNPAKQICSSIGAKEAVFHFPEGFINPGDVVLCPNPGYPPYERGTLFAEGKPYFYNLLKENNFLP